MSRCPVTNVDLLKYIVSINYNNWVQCKSSSQCWTIGAQEEKRQKEGAQEKSIHNLSIPLKLCWIEL